MAQLFNYSMRGESDYFEEHTKMLLHETLRVGAEVWIDVVDNTDDILPILAGRSIGDVIYLKLSYYDDNSYFHEELDSGVVRVIIIDDVGYGAKVKITDHYASEEWMRKAPLSEEDYLSTFLFTHRNMIDKFKEVFPGLLSGTKDKSATVTIPLDRDNRDGKMYICLIKLFDTGTLLG